jgi:magnesium-transporting ATPase (P-type)
MGRPVSGLELNGVDDARLAAVAEEATVFGRITPEQKDRLVRALRRRGHYVAMTGDGVNDVLALKQADLAIVMRSGSTVTRGVADIVLLHDSFAALPAAFREGRRILRGMQDIARRFLVRTLYVTLLIPAVSLLGEPVPVTPRQNAVLALLTVGIPTFALAAWARPGTTPRRLVPSSVHFVVPAAFSIAGVFLVVYLFYLSTIGDVTRALLRLVETRARMIRAGREVTVPARDLVPGDLVLLESGSRIPADLRLVNINALAVDESLLTGESVPVAKQMAPLVDAALPAAERANMAYAGTVVSTGRGRGYVVATGERTELGGIAAHVRSSERTETPLQRRMGRFARVVGAMVAGSAVVAFVLGVLAGEGAAEMFLVAVALAVSAVPEGLPIAFTINLAVGVTRMARRHAIVRRLPAVETLGSTTVIGADKTGTLTENRMTVREIWAGGRLYDLATTAPDGVRADHLLHLTLAAGVLANEAALARDGGADDVRGDPTEVALLAAAVRLRLDHERLRADAPVIAERPFEPEQQYSASLRCYDGAGWVFVKGAPERVIAMCSRLMTDAGPAPLGEASVQRVVRAMATRGLRVLAMAGGSPPPGTAQGLPDELQGLTLLGLEGLLDPPRPRVREAIAGCRAAGCGWCRRSSTRARWWRSRATASTMRPRSKPPTSAWQWGAAVPTWRVRPPTWC